MDELLLFSQQAEEALVGAALVNPDVLSEVDVSPDDFYLARCRHPWAAMQSLEAARLSIDFVTVVEALERANRLTEIGGASALAGMTAANFSSLNAEDYARIVRDYAARRRLIEAASLAAKAAHDLDARIDDLLPDVLDRIAGASRAEAGALHVSHYTRQVLEATFDKMRNPIEVDGIPTGFIDFDKITLGLQPGELVYWSGEPGVGKSISAMQIASQMAAQGVPVACYSLEMRGAAVVRRWVSARSEVQVSRMRLGIDETETHPIINACDEIDALPIYMSDKAGISTSALRVDLTRLQRRYGVRAFVLDYDYLLSDGRGLSENDRTILISATLKIICRDRDMVGLVIHSMTKDAAGRGMDALRGSKQVQFDGDWIIILRRDTTPGVLICSIEKGRELEGADEGFALVKRPTLPAVGNAARHQVNLDLLGGNGRKDLA